MVPRLALVTALVTLVVVLGVLSMHAIDAHPPSGSHHGPASEAANPVHGHGDEVPHSAPAPVPAGHHDPVPEGESAPIAQHLALCAAVILAAGSALRTAPAARRVSLSSVHRIVQAAFSPEPPVPRSALVAI